MSKEYIFKYPGTKESFMAVLNSHGSSCSNNSRVYYFDDYIVEVRDDEIRFGVERAGHSGGNWFISKFTEENDQIEFRGTIERMGTNKVTRTKVQKVFDNIEEILLSILFFPVVVLFFVISKIQWLIEKIRKQPNPQTTEEKLFFLMEKRLNCQRVCSKTD